MKTIKTSKPEREAIRLSSLWQKYGPNTYPLNIGELIDGAILTSGFRDELVIDTKHFDSFEGALVKTKNIRKWTILLNEGITNQRRQRFTFAHELGHFMCHRELRDRFEDGDETLNDYNNEVEKEANVFASWLLMPTNLMRDEFAGSAWETKTLCEIGNRFESSLQASALRYVALCLKPIAFVVSRDGIIRWSCKSKSAPYMVNYCFGDELPQGSHALASHISSDASEDQCEVGPIWNEYRSAKESQYFDRSGQGYQYTCIEFS